MGLLHVYCGDGKGKTTAAAGLALRALGRGLPVLFQQYLKDGTSSELRPLAEAGAVVESGMPEGLSGFTWTMNEEELARLRAFQNERLEEAFRFAEGNREAGGVIVLDEALASLSLNLLDEAAVLRLADLTRSLPDGPDLVLTGRGPSEALCEKADYLSEIKALKHPFDRGIGARPGIEY